MTPRRAPQRPARLVCCGLATLDVVQVVDALPRPDEKVVARDAAVTFGGPAANAAASAVALGVPTRLVTAIGASPRGALVRRALEVAGVEVLDLLDADRDADPPLSTVLVTRSTGERAVVSMNGTATPDAADLARARLDDALAGATALLVDGHHLGAAVVLAAESRERELPVLLDGGSWKPGLDALLAQVEQAVLSADFRLPAGLQGSASSGEVGDVDALLDAVAAFGPAAVARSAGAGPVRVRSVAELRPGGDPYAFAVEVDRYAVVPPQVPASEVVDTLGAGDVLHGALAAALARGETFDTALTEAIGVASMSVRYAGALGWVPHAPR
ncbi:PfkB family carbohydrate kinase [Cellulomonas alba]|uniref:PfkB family carbohydrate kinase n=1 Tax=Cellulomonas alba TaxID=3053467 RepID=A0ABT7SIA1_9CELL|nr:PfkB family carbohydrate kinase [Cellulomonas alba]MDM7855910.1 PfkB family carbohydrate kinase [Cellulomonas alba]